MSPSPTPTQCEGCSSKFSWLRKRRTCPVCRSVCCSSCMQRPRLCGAGRQCLRCARLAGVRYERAALQQLTVRDLKHIMKIVDVSSATCREKSDLVDTILMCRGSPEEADRPTPTAPPLNPAPVPAPAQRPGQRRRGDSSRVGPLYESIRVRAVDDSESDRPAKQPADPSPAAASDCSPASLSREAGGGGSVAGDVETTDIGEDIARSLDVEARLGRPVDVDRVVDVEDDGVLDVEVEGVVDVEVGGVVDVEVEGVVDVEVDGAVNVEVDGVVDVEVDSAGPAVEESPSAAVTGGGTESDGEDQLVVDDDPDEPQSGSVAVEADRQRDGGDDPISETDVDLSRLTDVTQVPSEELLSRLSVRQCKQLLRNRRTEYRGVIEKEELLRRLRLLWRETRRNAEALAAAPERDICKVCMDALVDCVLLECGHMATCTACGKQMAECPICRKYVVRVVHVFRA